MPTAETTAPIAPQSKPSIDARIVAPGGSRHTGAGNADDDAAGLEIHSRYGGFACDVLPAG